MINTNLNLIKIPKTIKNIIEIKENRKLKKSSDKTE